MIQYIKIKNFGPIKDEVELSFEAALPDELSDDIYVYVMPDGTRLLKLAYIYGANASGKTTILTVFEFLKKLLLNPLLGKSATLEYKPFLYCADPLKTESYMELAFYANKVRHIYSITFSPEAVLHEKLVYYQSAKPTELFSRETEMDKRLVKIQFGSRTKVSVKERERLESNTLHNNSVMGAFAKTNADIVELNELNIWFSIFMLGLITSSTNIADNTAGMIANDPTANKWLNKLMNKADRQITKVSVDSGATAIENKREVEFTHHTDAGIFTLPFYSESKGMQRYFSLGGALYTLVHTNAILLIDDLETSLHPDLMKHFLQTFLANAEQSQMLITTHNTGLMEEIDFIRRDALWFSEKKADGSVDLYAASDFDSGILRKGASLINAYRAGKLGAKPNLGSAFIGQE